MIESGAFWFGIVVGFVTYRTLKHKDTTGISDIASVIAAIGGSAVLTLFPVDTQRFDFYAIGLAAGFFFYLIVSLAVTAWMGDSAGKTFLGD